MIGGASSGPSMQRRKPPSALLIIETSAASLHGLEAESSVTGGDESEAVSGFNLLLAAPNPFGDDGDTPPPPPSEHDALAAKARQTVRRGRRFVGGS